MFLRTTKLVSEALHPGIGFQLGKLGNRRLLAYVHGIFFLVPQPFRFGLSLLRLLVAVVAALPHVHEKYKGSQSLPLLGAAFSPRQRLLAASSLGSLALRLTLSGRGRTEQIRDSSTKQFFSNFFLPRHQPGKKSFRSTDSLVVALLPLALWPMYYFCRCVYTCSSCWARWPSHWFGGPSNGAAFPISNLRTTSGDEDCGDMGDGDGAVHVKKIYSTSCP